jgi:predicted hydrocarbon binding protein
MGDVRLPTGGLAELRRAIEQTAGENAVRVLREAGRRLAGDAEMAIAERGGSPLAALPLTTFWAELCRYFADSGWGEIEHHEVNEGVGAIVALNWAESDPSEGRHGPGCHLTTGLMAELLTRAVGQSVAIMEVECRSHGDDFCRFLFGSPVTLLVVHRKLSGSASLDEAIAAL